MSNMTRTSTTLAAGMLVCILAPAQAVALEGSWHLGISGGASLLSPETDGSAFTLEEDQSTVVSAYLGLDITPVISAEIAFTDLGEAGLSQDETITYQAVSIGAIAYVLGEKRAIDRAEGASLYVRLGFSAIDNESDIELTESNNTALWLGAGVQYPLSQNFGLRAEISSYDGDAQAVMAGVYWRSSTPGSRSSQDFTAPEPQVTETVVDESADTIVAPVPVPEQPLVDESVIAEQSVPSIVADIAQDCPPEAAASISDPQDCALFNSAVAGLSFVGDTPELTPEGVAVLDNVIDVMGDYPELVLEVRVHTQALGDKALEQQLSADRAKSVARYLVQNGIPLSQLRAKAFGATQPLAPDSTLNGRLSNNRVEFKSL
ncbi:MAG: OmpA family protein [Granulosicoccus sp.]